MYMYVLLDDIYCLKSYKYFCPPLLENHIFLCFEICASLLQNKVRRQQVTGLPHKQVDLASHILRVITGIARKIVTYLSMLGHEGPNYMTPCIPNFNCHVI